MRLIFVDWDAETVYFIELKSRDRRKRKHAYEQIMATFQRIWPNLQQSGIQIPHARIALGAGKRVPSTSDSGTFLELQDLFEMHGGTAMQNTSPWEEFPVPCHYLLVFHNAESVRQVQNQSKQLTETF